MLAPLSGYSVGVTADRRSDEQIALLEGRGATCLHGPTVKIHPLRPEDEITQATTALIERPPDIVVTTTGIGMRGWMEAADAQLIGEPLRAALAGARVMARGPKAHGAAVTAGLDVAWNAPGSTSAELVEHLKNEAEPQRVAVQVDGAPDHGLVESIAALGHDVVMVPVYRWAAPDDLKPAVALVQAVAERRVDAVTFTSRPAAENFLSLADDLNLLPAVSRAFGGPVTPFCVGPVCAGGIRDGCGVEPIQPSRFRLGALVMAVAEELTERSTALALGGVDVNVQGRLVAVDGQDPVMLTGRESQILAELTERPGVVVSKTVLLSKVWGSEESDPHVVEVTVGRLRRRLGPAAVGIETVMRRGYRASAT